MLLAVTPTFCSESSSVDGAIKNFNKKYLCFQDSVFETTVTFYISTAIENPNQNKCAIDQKEWSDTYLN